MLAKTEPLTDAERKALHWDWMQKCRAEDARVHAAREERSRVRKAARADGMILADIDFSIRCHDAEDQELLVDELRRRAEIAAWHGLPVNHQAGFDFEEESPVERAYREGEALGISGKPAPAAGAGEIEQAKLEGWHAGNKERFDTLQSALRKREAARAGDEDEEEDEAA
jgi:predicted nucleotidyltransferase